MNLPYIQSEIFRELVGMETLLKPECCLKIIRNRSGDIEIELWRDTCYRDGSFIIHPYRIRESTQITAEITRIWNEIPAECKREDILK